MRTGSKIIIGALPPLAIVCVAIVLVSHRSPPIQGKPASYWMKTLGDPTIDPTRTFGMLGPEAGHFFAKVLDQRNGPLGEAYLKLWPHIPVAVQKRLPRPLDARLVRRNAAIGLATWNAWPHTWKDTDSLPISHLFSALKDEDARVRIFVAGALQGCGVAHPEAGRSVVSGLTERLKQDPDASVRRCAAASLGFQGQSAQAAVPTLVTALSDTNTDVRFSAAVALKRIDPEAAGKAGADAAMVPALVKMLQRPDADVRGAAARGLAELGKDARPAVPLLLAALNDEDDEVRESAAKALKAIDIDAEAEAGVR